MASEEMTGGRSHRGYRFGAYRLDTDRAALYERGRAVRLRRQSFDVLRYLVERPARLVTREEILGAIWGNAAVTDDSLTHCLIDIRKAIGDTRRELIRTVPRRGFIFEIPVTVIDAPRDMPRSGQPMMVRLGAAVLAIAALAVAMWLLAAQQTTALDPDPEPAEALHPPVADVAQSEAVNAYLQARFMFNRGGPGDLAAARELLLHVLELEPGHAKAWASLAGAYFIEWSQSDRFDSDSLALSKAAAENAVALDPGLAEGWIRLGHYYAAADDRLAAERHWQRAQSVDPDDPYLLSFLAGRAATRGDLASAIDFEARALASDPLSVIGRMNLSFYLYAAGEFEEAIRESRRAQMLRSAAWDPLQGFALINLGRYRDAIAIAEDWPDGIDRDAVLAMARLALGHQWRARLPIRRLQEKQELGGYLRLAELRGFCEEIDASFDSLANLRDELLSSENREFRRFAIFNDVQWSPFFASLKSDPRWEPWLEEVRELTVVAGGAGRKYR